MTNRKSHNAERFAGKSYSPSPKKTRKIGKAKKVENRRDPRFEALWKNYYGSNYIDDWYTPKFNVALEYYSKFNSTERKKIAGLILKKSKQQSDEQKNAVPFVKLIKDTIQALDFEVRGKPTIKKTVDKIVKSKEKPTVDYLETVTMVSQQVEPVIKTVSLVEGTPKQITLTKYERNEDARRMCIAHYGSACSVCLFDFEKIYGTIGKNFVHVHHLVKVSSYQKSYQVDPINDLRPVCPNCHAIIHKRKEPYSIDEVKEFIKANSL